MTTATEEPTETPPAEGERLDRVEAKVDKLTGLVEKFIGSGGNTEPAAKQAPTRPEGVEEQVRAELARAKAEEAKQAEERETKETVASLRAKLEEKPPAPPVRRATKLLGWGDGTS